MATILKFKKRRSKARAVAMRALKILVNVSATLVWLVITVPFVVLGVTLVFLQIGGKDNLKGRFLDACKWGLDAFKTTISARFNNFAYLKGDKFYWELQN